MFPDKAATEAFLTQHWQRQPCFLEAALPGDLPVLEADELAWLATQPDVESRIVFTERTSRTVRYRVEYGPFEDQTLAGLQNRDWTLLVQDVDKHLPDFRAYFERVSFIPDWRIDDLMVSFASPGGSVGPHRDNYDVFLCQGSGTRCWRVSEDLSLPADDAAGELSLLKPFEPTATWPAGEGDVVYLPPGVAHWGIAKSPCMTYSIGMRAPTRAEIAVGIARVLEWPDDIESRPAQPEQFYTDKDLHADEADAGLISTATLLRLRQQGLVDASLDERALARAFGSVVTDPKAWLMPDEQSAEEASAALASGLDLAIHGMARLAWFQSRQANFAFANGLAHEITPAAMPLLRHLHTGRVLDEKARQLSQDDDNLQALLTWLLQKGTFDLPGNDE